MSRDDSDKHCQRSEADIVAIDAVGTNVATTKHIFLANRLNPPAYFSQTVDDKESKRVAAANVTKLSTGNALRQDQWKSFGGVSLKADFGWHTCANNNATSGNRNKNFSFSVPKTNV